MMLEHLSSMLRGIEPALANHLWQSTVFAAAAWLMTLLLRRNRAQVRYGLWLAASVKFLIPFTLLIGLGGLLPKPQHSAISPQIAMYSALDVASQPFSEMAMPPVPSTAHWTERFAAWLPVLLAAVWLCGVVTVLLVWFARWRQVSATLRRTVSVTQGREVEILRRLERRANTRRQIPLQLSRELMGPGIFGIFCPVLLWPERLSERLEDEHIEAILAHELIHARRHDNLTAALHMLVEAAFWFHPLVWWIERRMVEERERTCDEAVVQMGGRPDAYAESLLKACRFCIESPLTCVSGITGADLNRRIVSIVTPRLESLGVSKKFALGALGFIAVLGPVAFGVMRMLPVYSQILHANGPLPSFEVASIKPSGPEEPLSGIRVLHDGIVARGISIKTMTMWAYGFSWNSEISDGPNWIQTDKFDIEAKSGEAKTAELIKLSPNDRDEQQRLMMQSLLAERLKLKVSFQTKKLPVYELVVAKGGLKCTKSVSGSSFAGVPRPRFAQFLPPPPPLPADTPQRVLEEAHGQEQAPHIHPKGWPMWLLVTILEKQPEVSGRVVVDKTGLNGTYDCDLSWSRDGSEIPGPSFFTAIQEQLGLKLVPMKAPVEVLIIDHVEQPTPN